MKSLRGRSCALGLMVALCFSSAPRAFADAPASEEDEAALLEELEQLDRRLVGAQQALRGEEARYREAAGRLRQTEAERQETEKTQAEKRLLLQKRLAALVRLSERPQWTLAQGGHSLHDALFLRRMMREVARHDRKTHAAWLERGDKLVQLEAESHQQAALLRDTVAARRRLRDTLADRRAAKSELAEAVLVSPEARASWLEQRRSGDKVLRGLVREQGGTTHGAKAVASAKPLLSPPPLTARNALAWPAEGPITASFGERKEAHYGTVTQHQGLDISAPLGSPARAVARGRVVYADWLRGYGQVVIVDHEDGFHAVLAHLGQIDVAPGDRVEAGDALGQVGDTGSLKGPLLYLELRKRGAPIDPLPFFPARPAASLSRTG